MVTPLLEAAGLRVRRNGIEILGDVSLSVHSGELVWFIGPNGSGKTTLLRCLLGLMAPDGGEVFLNGRALKSSRRNEVARQLSYVPQTWTGDAAIQVRAFVTMGRYVHVGALGVPSRRDEQIARRAMTEAGVEAFADRSMSALSGGERQRVLVAASLAQEATALILDEPTANMDPLHQIEILALLQRLHARGRTVLCATHDLNSPAVLGGRVVAVKRGKIILDGPSDRVISPDLLRAVYDVPFDVVRPPGRRGFVVVPVTR